MKRESSARISHFRRQGVLDSRRGATQVEMTICSFLLMMLLLGVVDICRMMLVYTAISNSARAGARYAIVHGWDRPVGTGVNDASSSGSSTQVENVVRNIGSAGLLTPSLLAITVTYPDAKNSNTAGSNVIVKVTYPFKPLVGYFPLSVTLGNTSQGIITY